MNFPETFSNWQIGVFWLKGTTAPMNLMGLFLTRHMPLRIGRSRREVAETSSGEAALRLLTTT
jgi:hypothetical protein